MRGVRRQASIVLALTAFSLLPIDAASAGGVVVTTGEIEPGECRQGAPAYILGPGVVNSPLTIGCAGLPDGTDVLLAADAQGCFYTVPEGVRDAGGPRCPLLERPPEKGGPIPVFPQPGVLPDAVRRAGPHAGLVLSGQASAAVSTVDVHYELAGGARGTAHAIPVPVRAPLARRLGATRPFGYFAASLPTSTNTCRPIVVQGFEQKGDPIGPRGSLVGAPSEVSSPPLAGSRRCAARALITRLRSWAGALLDLALSSRIAPGKRQDPLPTRVRTLENRVAADPIQADRSIVIGRSAQGRPIRIAAIGSPVPSVSFDPRLLVFGCIHGTECAATAIRLRESVGCPLYDLEMLWVPNINPDGLALGNRVNGRGVDLNRNFPAGWKPIGRRFSPQYSGPRPFSEPESRLAARLIRAVRPRVTIWFHQHGGQPFVRAWGGSVPAAREFAELADIPFERLPWLAGTAPHWQNTRFRGTASFVVELPPGPLSSRDRLRFGAALVHFARSLDGGG